MRTFKFIINAVDKLSTCTTIMLDEMPRLIY